MHGAQQLSLHGARSLSRAGAEHTLEGCAAAASTCMVDTLESLSNVSRPASGGERREPRGLHQGSLHQGSQEILPRGQRRAGCRTHLPPGATRSSGCALGICHQEQRGTPNAHPLREPG